ncbi:protein RETICULATA-RELATED 3, chloroplastic-like [Coffea eugenioides]|uniref:Protein RETICULATA-RELATED 3, chloroplastic-like n=1 Tax=Coffea arabica TaxID=13443 RepID=A0ABM4USI9_COFAR|nr:protein RETICULATA-RELATED 3, chloroplastic-like [Coffea eugenioides]
MATMAQLRYSPLPAHFHNNRLNHLLFPAPKFPLPPTCPNSSSAISSPSQSALQLYASSSREPRFPPAFAAGGDSGSIGGNRGLGGGGGPPDESDSSSSPSNSSSDDDAGFGPIGAFLSGWRSRVAADPQFPFKVLMEELVGVTACVLGDMASRPNFGLNELDFVFSTLVVGSILNFVLMYLLAPTAGVGGAPSSGRLPSIFASCPPSHMFEPGAYGVLSRMGTFVYKGTLFAAVGFAAGLVGTVISNALIKMRKKMDPNFQTPNKPPPTLLNALTWAVHMGVSSNFRYQTLNGIEFLLATSLPSFLFKSSIVVLRCLNNVLGGMSFVVLARLTGSQAAAAPPPSSSTAAELEQEQQQLVKEEEVGARKGGAAAGDALPADKVKLINDGTGTEAKQY